MKVLDAATGEQKSNLDGHEDRVWTVAFSPDGKRLVTASDDGTGRIWDAVTGELKYIIDGYVSHMKMAVFSPDGKRVATGFNQGTVQVWRVGDIEDMLGIACNWVHQYLKNSPSISDSDRNLCD